MPIPSKPRSRKIYPGFFQKEQNRPEKESLKAYLPRLASQRKWVI
jgi:hypothetical protein